MADLSFHHGTRVFESAETPVLILAMRHGEQVQEAAFAPGGRAPTPPPPRR